MNDLMPGQSFYLSQLKDWSVYEKNLQERHCYYVKKYFSELFKKWVQDLPNPFIVGWLEQVFLNNGQFLLQFDQITLRTEQEKLGEKLFRNIINELEQSNHTDLFNVYQAIESFWGETFAAKALKLQGRELSKIYSIGDFETAEEIISVKTAFGMDFNYEVLERCLRSLVHLNGNEILKKYNAVRFAEQKGMNYNFRADVLRYFENNLVGLLSEFHSGLRTHNDMINRKERLEHLEVDSIGYKNDMNHIDLTMRDTRPGCVGYLRVFFEELNSFPWAYSVHEDTDTWWITILEHDTKFLEDMTNKIKPKVEALNSDLEKHGRSESFSKKFIGWINVETHVQHDDYKKEIEPFNRFLRKLIGEQPFDVYLYFGYQRWQYDPTRLFLFEAV